MQHHPDCHQCCAIGRCHYCGAAGKIEAEFEKPGTPEGVQSQRFTIRLCPTHYAWAAAGGNSKATFDTPGVAAIDFRFAGYAEVPDEPTRRSESFQNVTLNMALLSR